jgi:hypothetical protein
MTTLRCAGLAGDATWRTASTRTSLERSAVRRYPRNSSSSPAAGASAPRPSSAAQPCASDGAAKSVAAPSTRRKEASAPSGDTPPRSAVAAASSTQRDAPPRAPLPTARALQPRAAKVARRSKPAVTLCATVGATKPPWQNAQRQRMMSAYLSSHLRSGMHAAATHPLQRGQAERHVVAAEQDGANAAQVSEKEEPEAADAIRHVGLGQTGRLPRRRLRRRLRRLSSGGAQRRQAARCSERSGRGWQPRAAPHRAAAHAPWRRSKPRTRCQEEHSRRRVTWRAGGRRLVIASPSSLFSSVAFLRACGVAGRFRRR